MFGDSFLTFIWIVWGAVTAAFVVLTIWKSVAGLSGDNFVILDPGQTRQVSGQQAKILKVDRLTLWMKYLGFTSLGLLLISAGVWIYRGIVAFNGGRTP